MGHYLSYYPWTPSGRTALMEACRGGCNTGALDALIQKGANVNAEGVGLRLVAPMSVLLRLSTYQNVRQ